MAENSKISLKIVKLVQHSKSMVPGKVHLLPSHQRNSLVKHCFAALPLNSEDKDNTVL